jgi:RNA-binding protein Musashi
MRDRNTGDPRGFAFVVFKEDSYVQLVLDNLPHVINHKVVDVKRAQARGTAPPSIHGSVPQPAPTPSSITSGQVASSNGQTTTGIYGEPIPGGTKELTPEQLQNKVFVGGLPLHIGSDQLAEFFSQFGTVVDAIVMMDPMQQRSRGFGFVTFENGSGGAQKTLAAQPIYIENKYVEIKLATPKGDQQAQVKLRYQTAAPGSLRNAAAAMVAASTQNGEFAGLAASYGRNGWRAGYGTKAFGPSGWAVIGWDDEANKLERSGFSFSRLDEIISRKRIKNTDPRKHAMVGNKADEPPAKRGKVY